jgi:O-antigen ligase
MPSETLEFIITASNDNGRINIYLLSLELFSKFPIFGVGLGHSVAFLNAFDPIYNGFFHSTFFHSIASMGIIGLLAYVLLYLSRIKLLAKNNTSFGLFAMISFFTFAIYAMVENSEVNIIIVYITALFAVASVANNEKQEKPLPLIYDRRAFY